MVKYKERPSGDNHPSALDDYNLVNSENGAIDKIKRGLYRVDSKFGFTDDARALKTYMVNGSKGVYNTIKRHKKATAAAESGITAASAVGGYLSAKAVDAVLWDPDPTAAGRHIKNYAWPFVTKQLITVLNSKNPNGVKSTLYFPEKFGYNAAFYGSAIFLGLNAAALGGLKLYIWNEDRKDQKAHSQA